MLYWIIIGVLIVAIIAVIFFTVSKLLKEKKDYNQFERRYHSREDDYDDDYDDDEEDEDDVHLQHRRSAAGRLCWRMWTSRISTVLSSMIHWESEESVHRQIMTSFFHYRKI